MFDMKEYQKEYHKKYYEANRERILNRNRLWRENNKDHKKLYMREYRFAKKVKNLLKEKGFNPLDE